MIDFITFKIEYYTRKGIVSFWKLKKKLAEDGIFMDKKVLIKRIKLWKRLIN